MEKQYALITGASGGIGREFAYELAKYGFNIISVARCEEKLLSLKNEIESKYGVGVTVLPHDMTEGTAADKLKQKLDEMNIHADVLVNNAGFGDNGEFLDSDWEKQKRMLELNVFALVRMTYVFGGDMKKRRGGKILNVASAAALSGGPYMAMYYATKNFVLAFSEALYEELKHYGITVTAVCPGPTDTEFEKHADMNNSVMFSIIRPERSEAVAKAGVKALMKGKCIRYHGIVTNAFSVITRFVPRKASRALARKMNMIKNK